MTTDSMKRMNNKHSWDILYAYVNSISSMNENDDKYDLAKELKETLDELHDVVDDLNTVGLSDVHDTKE